ncbi:stomatin-like protein 1 isoform X1 [Scyliorhinus torazame]|uniref:stomatin-like protein 1 isoform X1 n=1 Tax=Scyliorhinus torazame TaxID=75743 RepID=UPI003B59B742
MSYQPVPDSEETSRAEHPSEEQSSSPARRELQTDNTRGCPELICSWILIGLVSLLVVFTFPITGWFVLKSVPKYERFVVFRLGRIIGSKGPGMILLLPFVDQWQKVDLRSKAFTITPFEALSRDGAVIVMGAEVHHHIWNPVLSVAAVGDIDSATSFTTQKTMVLMLHKRSLAKLQEDKSKIGERLVVEVNRKTKRWGLEVQRIDLILHRVLKQPESMLHDVEPPPGTRLNKLPAPLRKLAAQILQNRSPPQLEQPLLHPSDSEASAHTSSVGSASEEAESDLINPDWILSKVKVFLSEDLVKQIGACYLFTVNQKDGTQNLYYLDLSRESGMAGYGMPEGDPDVTLEVTEDTMQSLFSGLLKPFSAYMSGRIRVQGDLKLAMKLEDLIKKLNR